MAEPPVVFLGKEKVADFSDEAVLWLFHVDNLELGAGLTRPGTRLRLAIALKKYDST